MAAEREREPRFSVVIPTYERRDVVVDCVRALGAQQEAPPFEVIVVVDGSTDGTAEVLRGLETPFALTVLEQENRGRSAACNRGAEAARGETLLFLDDDMEADPHLLAEHARAHDRGADVVLGDIPLHPDSPRTFVARWVGEWAERRRRELAERDGRFEVTDFLTGQTSLPRTMFLDLGGFDTGFTRRGAFGGEDFDLGLRLRAAGARVVFNAAAVSRQRYVVTPRAHLRQWHDVGRARVMLARKHPAQTAALLDRRERRSDRFVWRPLRRPLRWIVLRRIESGHEDARTVRWFRRVRDLEYFAGVHAAGGVPARRAARVLCYHAVADLKGAAVLEQYGMPPAWFRRQIRFLARHFHFVDGAEFVRSLQGSGLPRRPVLLTFDDCTRDLLEVALPTLREQDVPAVAFAVTGQLGGTNTWDRVKGAPELRLLGAAGLVELSRSGVEIGTHTRTHPALDRLPEEAIRTEIEDSIADLEGAGLRRPSLLAYPHGAFDDVVRRVVAETGLAAAFSTKPGLAQPDGDAFAIPRIEILRRHRGPLFALKVVTGWRLGRP